MSIVSNNIKYLRKLNGMTQEEFARRISIKRSLLGAYEEARANPNLDNLRNMASAFGISVDQLLTIEYHKIKESTELTLPFSAARQMTVSHSGPVSSPRSSINKEISQKVVTPIKEYAFEETEGVPTKISSQPINQNDARERGSIHAEVSTPPVSKGIEVPVFNKQIASPVSQTHVEPGYPSISWVSQNQQKEYLSRHLDPAYLTNLPVFQLPNLPNGNYRAFQIGQDFAFPGALLVGSFVRNWFEIKVDNSYIFVLQNHGFIFRNVSSLNSEIGVLRLTSDNTSVVNIDVSLESILEVWEVKTFISNQLPSITPNIERVGQLVKEIYKELNI